MKKITLHDVDELEIEITSALCKFTDNDDKINEIMREISLVVRRMMIRWLTEEDQKEGEMNE